MRVTTLIKTLQIILLENPRASVYIDKTSFNHPLEQDGVTILDVESASRKWIGQLDGDGFMDTNLDGTQKGKFCVVLRGDD